MNHIQHNILFEFCDRHIRMWIGVKKEQTWIKMQQNRIIAKGINYITIL